MTMIWRWVVLSVLLVGCATDEDNVMTKLGEGGFSEVVLQPAGSKAYKFTAKRGPDNCTGDARIGADGAVTLREECRPPAGPQEAALPEGASDKLRDAAAGCDQAKPDSCVKLAKYYLKGAAIAADPARALGLLDAACTGGHADACTVAGEHLSTEGAGKDMTQALAKYDQGCKLGDPIACARVAEILLEGDGVKKDANAAMASYERACLELNEVSTCAQIGLLYDKGAVVPKNEAGAWKVWKHGCDKGSQLNCGYAGLYLFMGSGTKPDKVAGKAMLQASCDAKIAWSCDMVKKVH